MWGSCCKSLFCALERTAVLSSAAPFGAGGSGWAQNREIEVHEVDYGDGGWRGGFGGY